MAWLVRDDEVLVPLEVARTRAARRRGLLGRSGLDGALLLRPARSVHTIGLRFPIDVAHCRAIGGQLEVLRVTTMAPNRLGALVARAGAVLEAESGALARWGIGVGDVLGVRPS